MSDISKPGNDTVHVPSGATPFSPVVATGAGTSVINDVAHLLAISPAVVTVVVVAAVTVLGIDRVLHATDVVTVLSAAIGAHQAVVAAQSLKRSG